jgi:fibronectin-binding autotransporter adhesin
MQKSFLARKPFFVLATTIAAAILARADTQWISTSDGTFSSASSWSNNVPSTTNLQIAVFAEQNPSLQTVQHSLNLATTNRVVLGLRFDSFTGGSGFDFQITTANPTNGGLLIRGPGVANTPYDSIVNHDDNVQTLSVPVQLFTAGGGPGAVSFLHAFRASGGDLFFTGDYPSSLSKPTLNNNGFTVIIDGAFNTTIGSVTGRGDISGAGGLTKTGTGMLELGGTLANSYTGPTTISAGSVVAKKTGALGSGALTVNGGSLDLLEHAQSVGAVTLVNGTISGTGTLTGTSFTVQNGFIDAPLAGPGGLTKTTGGTVTLTSASTYAGPTTISGGTLRLAFEGNRLPVTSNLILNSGTLDTGGLSQQFGTLDLNASSLIDFGSGFSDLAFADSDLQDWGGFTLTIVNWTPGVDSLRIGTDGTGFDTQLGLIRFADFGNVAGKIDTNGYVTPVPEPSAAGLLAASGGMLLGRRRRRE